MDRGELYFELPRFRLVVFTVFKFVLSLMQVYWTLSIEGGTYLGYRYSHMDFQDYFGYLRSFEKILNSKYICIYTSQTLQIVSD